MCVWKVWKSGLGCVKVRSCFVINCFFINCIEKCGWCGNLNRVG